MNSHEIESRLKLVRGRIRRAQRSRAAWIIATTFLGGLLAIMAADYFLAPLPNAARWVLFGAWIIALAFAAKRVLAPLFRRISLIQISRWIEARHPEMEERLSTVLELSKTGGGVSPELLAALAEAAGKDISHVDPQLEVKAAQKRMRWGKPAAALAIVLLACLAIWPKEVSRLLVRAVAPFSDVGNAGAVRFTIEPGDLEVMEGDAIRIKIGYEGNARNIDLVMKMNGGSEITQPLLRDGNRFTYTLDPARESFTYLASSGRARSDRFTATVWPLPRLVDPRVRLAFPAHTGLPQNERGLGGEGIEAVEGTAVTLAAKLNTPVREGWLEISGKKVADAKIENDASGGRISFDWSLVAGESGEASVKFRHHLGREIEALRFPVEVTRDQAPQVVIVTPSQKEIRVRPDERLNLRYEVTEDFSLVKTVVEAEAGNDRKAELDQTLPFPVKGSLPPRYNGSAEISVGSLRSRFRGAHEIKLRVRAEDGKPADLGGPGVGTSDWLTIRIDRNAESLARQALRAEHDEARQEIEKAIQEARQAKDQIDSLREEVKKEAMNENAVKRLEQSAEKLAAAEERVEQLAEEMERGIHAAKADEVAKAAENLTESREDLQNAPLQDKPENREQQLAEAKQNAEEAIKQLEDVRSAMDRDREKVQDLARVQELAQQQQELARQAMENLENPPESPKDQQEWQNQQRQLAEQVKQQLRERPDALAEALKQQAEQAKAMAEEARDMAQAQQDLRQQAEKAAQPDQAGLKEQLQQAIAKEQEKISGEAKEQLAEAQQARDEAADLLPEATAAADSALEQMQQNQPQAAAEAAKQAAEAMKQSAKAADPAGGENPASPENAGSPESPAAPENAATPEATANDEPQAAENGEGEAPQTPAEAAAEAARAEALGDLAERQEQLAGAMEALAKGDVNAALQGLQEAQAEAAENLAEAIKEAPLVDNTGHMNEAANNAQQGAQQAENAGQQGEAGQQQQAAQQHAQSAQNFQKSAEALDRAAQEFAQQAEQIAAQPENPNKAPLPAGDMAEAFSEAAEAAASEGAEAAQASAEAAAALSQAARTARESMRGQPMPGGPKGPPSMANQPGQPNEKAPDSMDRPQQRSADPGVPPELARLGISAADWEKIKANLASDVGAGGADAVPDEYRGLVKGYFESMSKKKD